MNKSENKGLLATAILLVGLFLLGYYGRNSSSEISNNTSAIEGEQIVSTKN